MAHMIDRMMYSGEEPWHGLGIKLPETCDADTLRNLVFDWTAQERPVFYQGPDCDLPTSDYKALVRSDNGKLLCIAPRTYGVVQFADACDVLNAAAQDGSARFTTAGTLDEGRRAWALATIPSAEFDIAGSPVKPYLLMSTSHDGTLAIRYHFTGVYVVCNNTLTAALGDIGVKVGGKTRANHLPNVIVLKHTSGVNGRLAIAKGLIERARSYFGAFNERALVLVNQRFTNASMRELTETLFPVTPEQAERRRKHGEESASHKAQDKIVRLFNGEQRAADNAPGTKWSAYNAVTEYIDHFQRRHGQTASALAEARFDSIVFGAGARIREQALTLLLAA